MTNSTTLTTDPRIPQAVRASRVYWHSSEGRAELATIEAEIRSISGKGLSEFVRDNPPDTDDPVSDDGNDDDDGQGDLVRIRATDVIPPLTKSEEARLLALMDGPIDTSDD